MMLKRKHLGWVILLVGILLLSIAMADETQIAVPGEQLLVDFIVSGDTKDVISIMYQLDFDHQAFELYPPGGMQKEKGIFESDHEFTEGEHIPVLFRTLENAEEGEYQFRMSIDQAIKSDYSVANSMEIEPVMVKVKKTVSVGSHLFFGHYEQDNNINNGKEPIEWIVLDFQKETNKALLLSYYGLNAKPYNEKPEKCTWESCTLRSWLNSEFYLQAFKRKERSGILETSVDNSASQGVSTWKTQNGQNTKDRIFLLSFAEAENYLHVTIKDGKNNHVARAASTDYAEAAGASATDVRVKTDDGQVAKSWWLRSIGFAEGYAAIIKHDGNLRSAAVNNTVYCVRPALWVDLQSVDD